MSDSGVLHKLIQFINNRNTLLVAAVFMGLLFGKLAGFLQDVTLYLLAAVMAFSLTGIENRSLMPVSRLVRPFFYGIFLNYFLFGLVVILLSWLLLDDPELYIGFVVIAATPPGVAIIPFTSMLGGDLKFAVLGVFGAFLGSVVLAPLILWVFCGTQGVGMLDSLVLMVELVILPFIFSRVLVLPAIFPTVRKVRGQLVNWGFALIIFTAVGINREVFFSDVNVLLRVSLILLISIFGLGYLIHLVSKYFSVGYEKSLPAVMLATIKSSGFAAVTAFAVSGDRAAIPGAVMAVAVLAFLLVLSFNYERKKRT